MFDAEQFIAETGLTQIDGAFESVPEGHGAMAILGRRGDYKIIWNKSNQVEVDNAKESFEKLTKKGFLAFVATGEKGIAGEQVRTFDPSQERLIFTPPMQAG